MLYYFLLLWHHSGSWLRSCSILIWFLLGDQGSCFRVFIFIIFIFLIFNIRWVFKRKMFLKYLLVPLLNPKANVLWVNAVKAIQNCGWRGVSYNSPSLTANRYCPLWVFPSRDSPQDFKTCLLARGFHTLIRNFSYHCEILHWLEREQNIPYKGVESFP